MATVEIWKGDIVHAPVEAIVNAANSGLTYGSGVCGAVFEAAGRMELTESCREIGGCKTGQAVVTPSHRLSSRGISHIIHAVGPKWHEHTPEKADALLESAYRSSLVIAEQLNLSSIAFPTISTGVYKFPKDRGAEIAVRVARAHSGSIKKILLVGYDAKDVAILQAALDKN